MSETEPHDFAAFMNENPAGWSAATGLRFVRATRDEVVAELDVDNRHLQAYGVVHGGVHAGIIETIASVGAALDAGVRGDTVLGLENHTSFIRAVREGRLRAVAKPITRGRRTQVWEATVYDPEGRIAATGRVRLIVLTSDAEVAGERVSPKLPEGS